MMKSNTNSNTNFKCENKYVPPNKRSSQKAKLHNKHQERLNMKSAREFPELCSSIKKEKEKETEKTLVCSTMNYASATREDDEQPREEPKDQVAPGWVKLTRSSQTSVIKEYGEATETSEHTEPTNWGLTKSQSTELKRLVTRWQTERDVSTDYLDQNSPYWGMKHIDDPFSDDDLESDTGSEMSNSDEYNDEMLDDPDYFDDNY